MKKTKESPSMATDEYQEPPPTLYVHGDFVDKVFGKKLPKLGAEVTLKLKVSSISEKEEVNYDKKGQKTKLRRSVDLQLGDSSTKLEEDSEIDLDKVEKESKK